MNRSAPYDPRRKWKARGGDDLCRSRTINACPPHRIALALSAGPGPKWSNPLLADSKRLKAVLARLAADLGDPVATKFTSNQFCEIRRIQLEAGVHGKSLNTKSRKIRTIPICPDLEKELHAHYRRHGLFSNCMMTFSRVLETTSIRLPPGQATHVLRHTFASHFVIRGGNILTLQKILGHSSLAMTMRYSHLSPDHLQDALRLNPLFDSSSTL